MTVRQSRREKNLAIVVTCLGAVFAQAETRHVDVNYDGGNGASDGTSQKPYRSVGAAVADANGSNNDVILVADGNYRSTLNGGLESFGADGLTLTKPTTIQGGYPGQLAGESFDWETQTLHSTVIDLQGAGARAFYMNTANDQRCAFHGIAFVNASHSGNGGAILNAGNFNTGVTVTDCLFSNNVTTASGGGVNLSGNYKPITLLRCVFVENAAATGGGAYLTASGGGIVDMQDCRFELNRATAAGGGGAVCGAAMTARRCQFLRNAATNASGIGGGISASANSTLIRAYECVFTGNSAKSRGGAIAGMNFNPGSFTGENCLINCNTGVYAVAEYGNSNAGNVTLRHCTVADNSGGGVRADLSTGNGNVVIKNCILANNGATGISTDDTTPEIDFNVVFGHTANYTGTAMAGADDLSVAPGFVSSLDYHLTATSPCVDTATNLGIVIDLEGAARPARDGYDRGCYELAASAGGTVLTVR